MGVKPGSPLHPGGRVFLTKKAAVSNRVICVPPHWLSGSTPPAHARYDPVRSHLSFASRHRDFCGAVASGSSGGSEREAAHASA